MTQIDCEELHDGQVIETGVTLDSSLTLTEDVSLWQKDAEDKCSIPFKDFVGYTYDKEDGRFLIAPIIEDPSTPTISCAVVDADGKSGRGQLRTSSDLMKALASEIAFFFQQTRMTQLLLTAHNHTMARCL